LSCDEVNEAICLKPARPARPAGGPLRRIVKGGLLRGASGGGKRPRTADVVRPCAGGRPARPAWRPGARAWTPWTWGRPHRG